MIFSFFLLAGLVGNCIGIKIFPNFPILKPAKIIRGPIEEY